MQINYYTLIPIYLHILGQFDGHRTKAIELKLIQRLSAKGCSPHRYRRYKTDRNGDTPLLHQEAELIYAFFTEMFDQAIAQCEDDRYMATLKAWKPNSLSSIYSQQPLAAAS